MPPLKEAIANYYKKFYGANITADNVAVFAGGRPALIATLLFLQQGSINSKHKFSFKLILKMLPSQLLLQNILLIMTC